MTEGEEQGGGAAEREPARREESGGGSRDLSPLSLVRQSLRSRYRDRFVRVVFACVRDARPT